MEEVAFELSLSRSNSLDGWRSDSGYSRQRGLCKQEKNVIWSRVCSGSRMNFEVFEGKEVGRKEGQQP